MIPALPVLLSLVTGLCGGEYERTRADHTECPTPSDAHFFWWPPGQVTYVQNDKGNPPSGDVFTAVTKSWKSWQTILDGCGERTITENARLSEDGGFQAFTKWVRFKDRSSNLSLAEGPRVRDRTVGFDPNSANNINLILFRTQKCSSVVPQGDSCDSDNSCGNKYDCWELGSNVIAITTSTYDPKTGKLFDADIELNAAGFTFTTVDSPICAQNALPRYDCVATDVQNTATHELGHSLGLDHTSRPESTMNPNANIGETSKRVVDPGSQHFVCDVYPKSSGCSAVPGEPLTALGAWVLLRIFGRRPRSRSERRV